MGHLEKLFNQLDFENSAFDGATLSYETEKTAALFRFNIQAENTIAADDVKKLAKALEKFPYQATVSYKYNNVDWTMINDYYQVLLDTDQMIGKDLKKTGVTISYDKNITLHFATQSQIDLMNIWKSEITKFFVNFGFDSIVTFELCKDNDHLENLKKIKEQEAKKAKAELETAKAAEKFIKEENKDDKKGVFSISRSGYTEINIEDIEVDINNVIIEGRVVKAESRTIRTGNVMLNFVITDGTDSIAVTAFEGRGLSKEDLACVTKNSWIRVWGDVAYEPKYAREHVVKMKKFKKIDAPDERLDSAAVKRVELHTHTKMSVMDGLATPHQLINQARNWGHNAIAITDHDSVQAFPDMQKCMTEGFKIIYGCELSTVENKVTIVANQKDLPLKEQEYVIFDFETTGLSAIHDKIIEFGAVRLKGGIKQDDAQFFIDPKRPISLFTTQLTGITDADVKGQMSEEEAIIKVKEYFGNATIVAHNAVFDMSFINILYEKYNLGKFENTVIDTLTLSRTLDSEARYHSLGRVAKRYKVEYDTTIAHRADYDAKVLADVFSQMLNKLSDKDIVTDTDLQNMQTNKDRLFQRPSHTTVLVKNAAGLKDLFKIISIAHTDNLAKQPRTPFDVLDAHRENLLVGSSCVNGKVWDAATTKNDEQLKEIISYFDYIEVQPPLAYNHLIEKGDFENISSIEKIIERIIKVATELNKIIVATGDVHYVNKEHQIYRDVLVHNMGIGGALHPLFYRDGRVKNLPQQHLLSTDEMLEDFKFLGEELANKIVVENTNKIADMIDIVKPIKDKLYTPDMPGAEDKFVKMCWDNAHAKYGKDLPEIVKARLEKELTSITTHGFAVVYYISHLLVKKSLEDGYLVGSRGSVGSSIAATMSNISEVNPLPPHYTCKCTYSEFITDGSIRSGYDLTPKECPKCGEKMFGEGHDIPFETFLGFKGDKVPDIDLNFSGEYQAVAHAYTKELFGEKNVFRAGTISTVASKTAFGYVKGFHEKKGIEGKRTAEIERLATGCEGVKRTTGQHPGGIIVIPNDMDVYDFTPVNFPADNPESEWKTTHFDFHSIHDNVLKLDILGHVDPTAIRMLEDLTGVDAQTIPTNDEKVIELFRSCDAFGISPQDINGETTGACGIPEFGTRFVRDMLKVTRPKSFAELVVVSGLSHGTNVYLNNAKDLIEQDGLSLKDVIGCRDDIMVYLMYMKVPEDEAFKIMEFVRKGKPKSHPGAWAEMCKTMEEYEVPKWYMESCEKIEYMFPKAHATAYVTMAWRVAWFKTYYPKEYYATYFTLRCDAFDIATVLGGKTAIEARLKDIDARLSSWETKKDVTNKEQSLIPTLELALEMLARGIEFENIDIMKSRARNFIISENGKIMPPFASIDGLGDSAAKSVIEQRAIQKFISKEDLKQRTKLNKTHLEILDGMNVLADLDESNQISLF